MQTALAPIMRDYLIRFQQTAIKETGRRPLTFLRTPLDEKLLLPGCQRPGYAFWQPIPWQDGNVPLGPLAEQFHHSIVEYLSMCQFLEIHFHLPPAVEEGHRQLGKLRTEPHKLVFARGTEASDPGK